MTDEYVQLVITRRNGEQRIILFDEADSPLLAWRTWHVMSANGVTWYARCYVDRKAVPMHHLLGCKGWDHINRNGLDNRRSNLRPATASQNQANTGPRPNCASPYKGVSYHRGSDRWVATIQIDGRQRTLGYVRTQEEAAGLYDAAALAKWGEYAYLNFPP